LKAGVFMDDRQERVMVFIDGSNMYHSLKTFFNRTDIDFGKFCGKLIGRRHLVRTYYYNARVSRKEEPERYVSQVQFFDSVAAIPYTELRLGRLVYNNWPTTPPYEKGVDVQLATDMLTHSFKNNYDTAILVAGDNDFVPSLQAVKDMGKHIEVALFGKEETSQELRRVADKILPINAKLLSECWKQLKQPPKPALQRQQSQQSQPRPQAQAQPRPLQQRRPLQRRPIQRHPIILQPQAPPVINNDVPSNVQTPDVSYPQYTDE
jgi:uncharacterized LabA/DUF88 family protein